MKTVKFIGTGVGPVLASPLLKKEYDFSKGVCLMDTPDADLLLSRCRSSYVELTDAEIMALKVKPVEGELNKEQQEARTKAKALAEALAEAKARAEAETLAKVKAKVKAKAEAKL